MRRLQHKKLSNIRCMVLGGSLVFAAAGLLACVADRGAHSTQPTGARPGSARPVSTHPTAAPPARARPAAARRPGARSGRAWLGVYMGSDGRPGVLVRKVHPGSPAAKAGLLPGDRIISINNATLPSMRALLLEVRSYRPGDKVSLDVRRRGKLLHVVVLLERLLSYPERVRRALVGKPAPPFSVLRVPAGSSRGTGAASSPRTISTAAMKGKLWLLEFWATWCGACRQVIPMLKRIHSKYAPYGLHVVSIAKDKVSRVAALVARLRLPYIVGVDPRGKVLSKYMVSPIPAFMLVNAKGVVIDVAVGPTWVASFRRMLGTIHKILTRRHRARLVAAGYQSLARPRPGARARPRPGARARPRPGVSPSSR